VENAYFLKFISAATGGTVVNFSDRFTLSSMTGTFSTTVTAGLKTVSGTTGPATQNNIQAAQVGGAATTATSAGAASYNLAYTLQTGTIRYAPMPPMAKSSITAKNASPQYPTSAYTVYQTIAGTPNAVTTNTMPITFSASSREATVRKAPAYAVRHADFGSIGRRRWPTDRRGDAKVPEPVERLNALELMLYSVTDIRQ
jgi:hypothetical protein